MEVYSQLSQVTLLSLLFANRTWKLIFCILTSISGLLFLWYAVCKWSTILNLYQLSVVLGNTTLEVVQEEDQLQRLSRSQLLKPIALPVLLVHFQVVALWHIATFVNPVRFLLRRDGLIVTFVHPVRILLRRDGLTATFVHPVRFLLRRDGLIAITVLLGSIPLQRDRRLAVVVLQVGTL